VKKQFKQLDQKLDQNSDAGCSGLMGGWNYRFLFGACWRDLLTYSRESSIVPPIAFDEEAIGVVYLGHLLSIGTTENKTVASIHSIHTCLLRAT
jgi:hypothetical protein